MNQVAVVIPVYKPSMNRNEEISFRQTLRVLATHPIIIVCPESLDLAKYNVIAGRCNNVLLRESFNDTYFRNIAGYNRLLLSEEFYMRFAQYKYILIAQLDTYVFRDELLLWCDKGYDYIGAPLIWYGMKIDQGIVGNGGFSLRRVEAFLNYFRGSKLVLPLSGIAQWINFAAKPYTRWFIWLLMAMGWHNTPRSFAKQCRHNEDRFWSGKLDGTNYELKKPAVAEAMDFAWERCPSELYARIGHLPFGCHAWEKYEYDAFWHQYIV